MNSYEKEFTKKIGFNDIKAKRQMKQKILAVLILGFGLLWAIPMNVNAQSDGFQINLRKDFGYNMGSTIQGRFTVRLVGDMVDVSRVSFYLDDEILGEVDSEPFHYSFSTNTFVPGTHRLFAEVQLKDGSKQTTSEVNYHFLSPKEASQQTTKLLLWIGGAIVGSMLVVGLVQMYLTRKTPRVSHTPGSPRNYGFLGGAICPRCGRAFPRHIWGINLVVGKLDRCEHCGKWFLATRATPYALRIAEEAELSEAPSEEIKPTAQEDQKKILDDTKYFDDV